MTTFLLGISYANIQAETSLPHPVLVSKYNERCCSVGIIVIFEIRGVKAGFWYLGLAPVSIIGLLVFNTNS